MRAGRAVVRGRGHLSALCDFGCVQAVRRDAVVSVSWRGAGGVEADRVGSGGAAGEGAARGDQSSLDPGGAPQRLPAYVAPVAVPAWTDHLRAMQTFKRIALPVAFASALSGAVLYSDKKPCDLVPYCDFGDSIKIAGTMATVSSGPTMTPGGILHVGNTISGADFEVVPPESVNAGRLLVAESMRVIDCSSGSAWRVT